MCRRSYLICPPAILISTAVDGSILTVLVLLESNEQVLMIGVGSVHASAPSKPTRAPTSYSKTHCTCLVVVVETGCCVVSVGWLVG